MTEQAERARTNTVWARTLVDGLARAGVEHLSLAPGSRSTPLVLAAAAQDDLHIHVHLDERSAAYFALGIGKATGRPAAVLTTSGTAAANLLPAVVEASLSESPLLMLTADRPPRLLHADANQTIDQRGLYGTHVNAAFDLDLPSRDPRALRHLAAQAARAVAEAGGLPAGPVHLNVPYEKPLEPPGSVEVEEPGVGTPTRVGRVRPMPDDDALDALADVLRSAGKGVVVAGPLPEAERTGGPLRRLAAAAGFPLLPDALSGARYGPGEGAAVAGGFDLLLREPAARRALRPDVVLRFGRAPTSAALGRWLEEHRDVRQVVIDAGGRWKDHAVLADEYLRGAPAEVAAALADRLGKPPERSEWTARWLQLDEVVASTRAGAVSDEFFEGAVLAEVVRRAPPHTPLFVSSSMPVRDLDTFGAPREAPLPVFGNRGASGVDGIVSSALGVAAGTGRRTVAVLGDLAFYHDMNGLLSTREGEAEVVFVVIHNDGGGIFHMLPIRDHEPVFTRCFATPHGLDFRHAADLYGLPYERVEDGRGFAEGLQRALDGRGSRILEVGSDREENRRRHESVESAVCAAVRDALTRYEED